MYIYSALVIIKMYLLQWILGWSSGLPWILLWCSTNLINNHKSSSRFTKFKFLNIRDFSTKKKYRRLGSSNFLITLPCFIRNKLSSDLYKWKTIFTERRKICNCTRNAQIKFFTIIRILSKIFSSSMNSINSYQSKFTDYII